MDSLFTFLFVFSIAALLVGRSRPAWVRMASRKGATTLFGSLALLFALLGSAFSDVEPTSTVMQTEPTAEQSEAPAQSSTTSKGSLLSASSTVAKMQGGGESAPSAVAPRETVVAQPESDDAIPDERVLSALVAVVAVVDGDTIKVSMNGTVETLRLIGIDTPETKDPRKPVQCFGQEASRKATELLAGRKVRLEADASQGERDKYGRLLRYVWREDGLFFNDWMIRNGYAFEYTYNKPYKYQSRFKEAQRYASDHELGLWNPTTCDGLASPVVGEVPSVTSPAGEVSGGHSFYTSSHPSAKYYYCDTDAGWKSLSPSNLQTFSSSDALLDVFPHRELHEPCEG